MSRQAEDSEPIRSDYPQLGLIDTRWADNDVYGHVNNVEYYAFFDTAINRFLIEAGGLDIHQGEAIGICAESHCEFLGSLAYPHPVQTGLRVGHLGRSSVRYEIALFDGESGPAAARGWFVHVFVDRETRKPVEIPESIRSALEKLTAGDNSQ
jgi:acyl-CoA thioester hydrolase